ncbi:MAG: DUF3352 domain-containing protein, partial [Phycisphaerae bacterium]|nr:DUF3352 domain-containing protein [Phycisphaerae bacterium]
MSARKNPWVLVAGVAALVICPALLLAADDSPDVLMREAAYQENTLGNLDAAIGLYERVVADEAAPKPLRAQARLRLGMCLAKRGEPDKASAEFQTVVEKHAEQPQLVAEAKRQLELFATANPASIMPPETIVYAELIRPGAQLEHILAMFAEAGMPDPLSAIMGRAAATQATTGVKGVLTAPAAMLLNPDMVREFKKIEGIAVGLQEIDLSDTGNGIPKFVAVLYPGQSDALRGILGLAFATAEGGASTPYGMAMVRAITVGRHKGQLRSIWLATSDRAFLASSDETTLKEALDRLAGKATSSLADSEEFQRQAAARRRDSAVLVYADMTRVMDLMRNAMKHNGDPGQLAVMETVGLDALEQVVSRLRLADHSLLAEVSAALKAGSACAMYDVLRTAKVDRSLLAYVPADVLGFATVSLDDGAKQFDALLALVEQVRKARNIEADARDIRKRLAEFKEKTGLDLRDDILANVQSVAVAAFQPAVPDITQGEDVHFGEVQTKASIPLVIVKVKDPAKFEIAIRRFADAAAR